MSRTDRVQYEAMRQESRNYSTRNVMDYKTSKLMARTNNAVDKMREYFARRQMFSI